ncbi:MAG: hypothetical protein ACI8P9_001099 [Parasphingorhabdus sp.]|jgi:hypothetical protein
MSKVIRNPNISKKSHQGGPCLPIEVSSEAGKTYTTPKITSLGLIQEITRMPGGSVNAEGGSGKPHQF